MKQINETNYLSDEGKVFVNKNNSLIYGWGISLGLNDSIERLIVLKNTKVTMIMIIL